MKTLTLGATLLLLSLSLPVIAQDSTQALSSHYDELANRPFPVRSPPRGRPVITCRRQLLTQNCSSACMWVKW